MYTLKEYLDSEKCFKLICGAGNKNFDEITKLCALYATAGCKFFDVNPSLEAINAAREGFRIAQKEKECFLCVSVGTKNDPHFSKCKLNAEKCISCGVCTNICIQKAIIQKNEQYIIDESKCIGCGKCMQVCSNDAIKNYSKEILIKDVLEFLRGEQIDCIEYHTITDSEEEIMENWNNIISAFSGVVSVCVNRSKLSNERLISLLIKMKKNCKNVFMVQADGSPMSGGCDEFRTTLQAVATADIIEKAKITPYIIMSGGTNSKTMELAKLCNLKVTGLAVGSYARKIVKQYTEQDDFLKNKKIFNEALKIAENLIQKI